MNDFSKLDAQDELTQFIKVNPREIGDDVSEYDNDREMDSEPMGSYDLSDDGDALASAGHGTDEDYGGGSHYEDFYGSEMD